MKGLADLGFYHRFNLGPGALDGGIAVELLANLIGGHPATLGNELVQVMG
jgi:hypothetical protein